MRSARNFAVPSQGKVYFIKNTTCEGPGYLAHLLRIWKISYKICDLERGDALPLIGPRDAVVVLGGPMSANDHTRSMLKLLKWIRGLLKREIPYLGICLGLQTLVKAAGGKVIKNKVKEIGFEMNRNRPFICEVTAKGSKDRLLSGLKKEFPIFQLHGETVMITKSMTLLARGEWCKNQIVKVTPRTYGLQGHLELDESLLRDWIQQDDDLRLKDANQLWGDYHRYQKQLHFYCQKIFKNFLSIAGMINSHV